MKSNCNYSILILLALFLTSAILTGQETLEKPINESWSGVSSVNVDHRHGTLEVIPHSSTNVRLEALLSVSAKDRDDAQKVLDRFEISRDQSGDKLTLHTKIHTKNWVTTNNNTRITFDDGSKVNWIKDISISYKLYVPNLEELTLSNKYEDIDISGDITGNLVVQLYDGDITAQDIKGDLDLNVKYGAAKLASCHNARIMIYDSEVELVEALDMKIGTKYSECQFGKIKSLDIESYDDEIEVESISEAFKVKDKYSDYQVGASASLDINIYDGEFAIDKTGPVKGQSKYTEFELGEVGNLEFSSAYDDDFQIDQIGSITIGKSKYSDYQVDRLLTNFNIESYDDHIDIRSISGDFNEANITAKYSDIHLPLNDVPGYLLEANCQYGDLDYPDPSSHTRLVEKGSKVEVEAIIGNPSGNTKVTITAHDCEIRLN